LAIMRGDYGMGAAVSVVLMTLILMLVAAQNAAMRDK